MSLLHVLLFMFARSTSTGTLGSTRHLRWKQANANYNRLEAALRKSSHTQLEPSSLTAKSHTAVFTLDAPVLALWTTKWDEIQTSTVTGN